MTRLGAQGVTRYNRGMRCWSVSTVLTLALIAVVLTGCVRRTITITSTPPGALVYLNDTEVGRTPVEVEFLYYGEYDVRLVREGYTPLVTSSHAKAPWWDTIGLDLIAEAVPGEPHAKIEWHYEMTPETFETAQILERADDLRDRLGPPPESPESPETAETASDAPAGDQPPQ